MDQLQNDREIDMIGNDASGGTSGEECQSWTKSLSTAADGILDIVLDT